MSAPMRVKRRALADAGAFFETRGAHGVEGTAMLAGDPASTTITRCVVPDQEAGRRPYGVWVEVTAKGKLELAGAIGESERWMARIHSHPDLAFHSKTDDENPGLTAEGAFSIVVPFYGLGLRRGLGACAVFVRRDGAWQEIPADRLSQHLVEVD